MFQDPGQCLEEGPTALLYSFKSTDPNPEAPTQPSVERGGYGNPSHVFHQNALRNQNERREAEAMLWLPYLVWPSHCLARVKGRTIINDDE